MFRGAMAREMCKFLSEPSIATTRLSSIAAAFHRLTSGIYSSPNEGLNKVASELWTSVRLDLISVSVVWLCDRLFSFSAFQCGELLQPSFFSVFFSQRTQDCERARRHEKISKTQSPQHLTLWEVWLETLSSMWSKIVHRMPYRSQLRLGYVETRAIWV